MHQAEWGIPSSYRVRHFIRSCDKQRSSWSILDAWHFLGGQKVPKKPPARHVGSAPGPIHLASAQLRLQLYHPYHHPKIKPPRTLAGSCELFSPPNALRCFAKNNYNYNEFPGSHLRQRKIIAAKRPISAQSKSALSWIPPSAEGGNALESRAALSKARGM